MNQLAFIGGVGSGELLLVFLVVLVLFGAKRIPELAKGLGEGIRAFKEATKEVEEKTQNQSKDQDKQ